MKYGSWFGMIAVVLGVASDVTAQPLSFLTEQQKLTSYCAGVSESRLRELGDFIKTDCASSKRRECVKAGDDLVKAQTMDSRLWAYLNDLYTSKDVGSRQKILSQQSMAKGSEDWIACKRRPAGQAADDLPACRESLGCLIDVRFSFLPP
jgi:hypothetical protein